LSDAKTVRTDMGQIPGDKVASLSRYARPVQADSEPPA